jgi:hypothetical protein
MAELSAHDPEPTTNPGPDSAGFPAAQPAAAPQQLTPGPAPDGQLPGEAAGPAPAPRLTGRSRHGQRLVADPAEQRGPLTPQQRLLILDAWARSACPPPTSPRSSASPGTPGTSARSASTRTAPAGLTDQPRGAPDGSRLPELTRRTLLLLKQSHPDWGCQKISDLLLRGPARPASPAAVARVLRDAGYAREDVPAPARHEPPAPRFERAGANQLGQTDRLTFLRKRQNRRVYLVAFLDDHSRFVTGFGLPAAQSTALMLDLATSSAGQTRRSARRRSRCNSMLPVPLNSSKITKRRPRGRPPRRPTVR